MTRQPRILVVDNNASDWLFAATTLVQMGYKVDRAMDGEHALAKVTKSYPQCLLLNVFLPDTSGYAICRHIRQSVSEEIVSIILTSTKAAPLDQNYGLQQGAQRYLLKPFTAELLIQTIREVIPRTFQSAPSSKQQPLPSLMECIPHRIRNQDEMRMSNPFAYSALKNAQARQLYSIINDKRAVHELAAEAGLNMKEVTNTLHMLIKEHYIQLYDSTGLLVESPV